MDIINNDGLQCIRYKNGKANIIFFTAYNDASFKIADVGFLTNINKIKETFNLKDVGYSKQIHSDTVNVYDGRIEYGDALITDRTSTAVGIFTADCVPVILYDAEKNLCAAVHSGWKGTYNKITSKVIKKMVSEFNSNIKNIYVYIGPHIKSCCYEVSQELLDKFSEDSLYMDNDITNNKNLDLQSCVISQCISEGLNTEHIYKTDLCTFCSKENNNIRFHSYRRTGESSGRMFSLIYMED